MEPTCTCDNDCNATGGCGATRFDNTCINGGGAGCNETASICLYTLFQNC